MDIKRVLILPFLLADENKPDPMGGQALIEGVLMRSKKKLGAAVRRKNGDINTKCENFLSWRERSPILKFPIIRGAVGLFESLAVGMRYLSWSGELAEINSNDSKKEAIEKKEKGIFDKLIGGFTLTLSFGVAILLFMYLPILVSNVLGLKDNQLYFNGVAGLVRITIFVGYVWAISLMKDVRRVFEYHGAEHKSIHAYEAKEELTVETASKYTTIHPRCGTSFMFIAGMACVVVFAIIDTAIAWRFGGYTSGLHRLFIHLLLVPFVSGVSFELLRLSDRFRNLPGVRHLMLPGLLLQRITTREPDKQELETAIVSLKSVL